MSDRVIIFDTTLRDGEQALQSSLTVKEKLQIGLALERLRVDVIEAGFPISSPGDFESVQTLARQIKNSRVCGLARCIDNDIDVAAEALRVSKDFRIHIFLATSALHMQDKLNMTFSDVVARAVSSVKRARNYSDDVEFSCEDAGRTHIDDLCRIVEEAIKAGATTINIPDTVGYTVPRQFGGIIESLRNRVPNIDKAIISVHCHDDLGMSAANSITAIQAGARQIEGAMNGLGERAGNCALEEVIMAIKVRQNLLGVHTNIDHQQIYHTSQMISQLANTPIPAHKAIIGSNAFAHSSGIHQDGVLKNRETYEILTPESIGWRQIELNLTSRSGRAAVRHRLAALGYEDEDYNLDELYAAFLKVADKKGQVFDEDLEALVFVNHDRGFASYFALRSFNVQSGSGIASTASVTLGVGDAEFAAAATGNGPVAAVYQAINRIVKRPFTMIKYQITAKGKGEDALGQVNIVVEYKGKHYSGVGLATDIVESSAIALINVLNRIHLLENGKQAFAQAGNS
jgi:2-isopropylmalate synthase